MTAAAENQHRIFLSSPHLTGKESFYTQAAFDSNWVAPVGPNIDAFEQEFSATVGGAQALALSSGTAAIHLALRHLSLQREQEVLVSTLTFAASVNPIMYEGGRPVFIDSERRSWNMDPDLLVGELERRARTGKLPAAVILVHLYGQSADIDPILAACSRFEVPLIEDAAEALGASYKGAVPGTFGLAGTYSFNGNKIITTSGGGLLLSRDESLIAHARKLATQARDPAPHYEHSEVGFNYRMSNILAGIGRAQLAVLGDRVAARRGNYAFYASALGDLPGIHFQPEAAWGVHTRWLTCLTIDPQAFGADREAVRLALEAENIESRPVWKPMHLQPVFSGYECVGGSVAEDLFAHGLCLPSGSNLTEQDMSRVVAVIRRCRGKGLMRGGSQ